MPDLLVAGTIYTLDPGRPAAKAALIRDGRFARVGTREECERAAGSDLRFIELGEGCAVPGLMDAHGHPLLHAQNLLEVRLGGARSVQECVARVAEYAKSVPDGAWIRGAGWDQNLWPGRDFPDSLLLSAATPAHPVALTRVDVHALWCNLVALRTAGIGASTPDPPGGRILRREDGSPSGVLIDTAMDLVRRAIPNPSGRDTEEMLLRSLRALAAAGLTCVHDAAAGPDALAAYARLAERDELPVRVYAMIDGQGPSLDDEMRAWRERSATGLLTVRSVKLFADGALGSRGAAMFEPYADDPSLKGKLFWDPAKYKAAVAELDKRGLQLFTHAIGDYGVRTALDADRKSVV